MKCGFIAPAPLRSLLGLTKRLTGGCVPVITDDYVEPKTRRQGGYSPAMWRLYGRSLGPDRSWGPEQRACFIERDANMRVKLLDHAH